MKAITLAALAVTTVPLLEGTAGAQQPGFLRGRDQHLGNKTYLLEGQGVKSPSLVDNDVIIQIKSK